MMIEETKIVSLPEPPPKFKRKPGKPSNAERAIMGDKPVRNFRQNFQNADLLCDALEYYSGDLTAFLKHYAPLSDDGQLQCLSHALLVLAKPENASQLFRWQALLEAFERAKMLYARQKAFKFIAEYNVPGRNSKTQTLASVVAYARFWLADHQAQGVAAARRRGNQGPEPAASQTLEKLLEVLSKDQAPAIEPDNNY